MSASSESKDTTTCIELSKAKLPCVLRSQNNKVTSRKSKSKSDGWKYASNFTSDFSSGSLRKVKIGTNEQSKKANIDNLLIQGNSKIQNTGEADSMNNYVEFQDNSNYSLNIPESIKENSRTNDSNFEEKNDLVMKLNELINLKEHDHESLLTDNDDDVENSEDNFYQSEIDIQEELSEIDEHEEDFDDDSISVTTGRLSLSLDPRSGYLENFSVDSEVSGMRSSTPDEIKQDDMIHKSKKAFARRKLYSYKYHIPLTSKVF